MHPRDLTAPHIYSVLSCLDLSHAGPTDNTTSTTGVKASRAGHEDRDNHRSHVPSPTEPEERGRSLGLTAALFRTVRTVRDPVVLGIILKSPQVSYVSLLMLGRALSHTELLQE